MEALVILLAEFLMVFLLPAMILAAEIAAIFLGFLLELALWLLPPSRGAASPSKTTPSGHSERRWKEAIQRWSNIFRPVIAVAFIGLVLTIGGLVLVNTLLFEPAIRLVVGVVGERTGTELQFRSVSGDLFTGRFTFEDISAKRVSDTRSSFSLNARRLTADIDMLTLIDRPIVFKTLSVDTVSGTIHQPEKQRNGGNRAGEGRIRAKRKFHVEDLTLSNVDIALSQGDGVPVAVSLRSVTSAPFRSNFAIFDVLFRSNVTGQIDGHDISISTQKTEGGRITQWRMPDLPAATVSQFVTRPPIGWLRSGTLAVSVDDRWTLREQAEIDMDWTIRMLDVHAASREGASLLEQTFALPIIGYIKSKDGNLDLRFRLVMNENQFENMASLDSHALWDALVASMAKAIANGTGKEAQDVRQGIDAVIGRFKGFLKKDGKPSAAE